MYANQFNGGTSFSLRQWIKIDFSQKWAIFDTNQLANGIPQVTQTLNAWQYAQIKIPLYNDTFDDKVFLKTSHLIIGKGWGWLEGKKSTEFSDKFNFDNSKTNCTLTCLFELLMWCSLFNVIFRFISNSSFKGNKGSWIRS